jgi:hypothetical protein
MTTSLMMLLLNGFTFVVVLVAVVQQIGIEASRRFDNVPPVLPVADDLKPIFRPTRQNVTVSPGEKASLRCIVDNLGTKTVIWRKQGDVSPLTIGTSGFSADSRIQVDLNFRISEWTLMIQDVRPSDEGLYHCQVSTKDASEHMYSVQLNVRTIQVSGTEYVERGNAIELMCNATGRPDPPHNVEWFKDGQIVHSDVQRGLIVTKKIETRLLVSVLSIKSSLLSDAGDYICLSSDNESASLRVHVLNVPANVGKRGTPSAAQAIKGRGQTRFLCSIWASVVAVAVTMVCIRRHLLATSR